MKKVDELFQEWDRLDIYASWLSQALRERVHFGSRNLDESQLDEWRAESHELLDEWMDAHQKALEAWSKYDVAYREEVGEEPF